MAGLYIHIPFCKEMILRKDEIPGPLQTIYFGGGTPSLLDAEDLQQIFKTIDSHFEVTEAPEITLEANPDDLTEAKLKMLAESVFF